VDITVPLSEVPRIAAAAKAIQESDTLTASDLWSFPVGTWISNADFDYPSWWINGEMDAAHGHRSFGIALERDRVRFSVQVWRESAEGVDHTVTVEPDLWWVDAAAAFKALMDTGL
jgi:hypothetical protein